MKDAFAELMASVLSPVQMLEAEVSVHQTVADTYITQALQLLDTAEVRRR